MVREPVTSASGFYWFYITTVSIRIRNVAETIANPEISVVTECSEDPTATSSDVLECVTLNRVQI